MSSAPPPPPILPLEMRQQFTITPSATDNDDWFLSLYDLNVFVKKVITKIRPVAQTGPDCGLAALSMVTSVTSKQIPVSDIFNEAKLRGFTYNGEMFSALNMKQLAETILSPWFKVELYSDSLAVYKSFVLDCLYSGYLMLIPYDADVDHAPCCKQGHKAHWALVCGVMAAVNGEMFVVARHGKSRYLAVWSFESLQRSNDNLAELSPVRVKDDKEYLLPPGGVKAGLASQFIILRRQNLLL